MPLPDEIRDLAEGILGRLDEARDYYLHTREAWRVVQQVAEEGRSGVMRSWPRTSSVFIPIPLRVFPPL